MAIVSVKEIHDGRDGETEITRDKSVRRYTRVFRVRTSSNDDEAAIVKASGVPLAGMVYPYDIAATCRSIKASNQSFSKLVWLVTCNYSTEREIEENPLDDRAEIEWSAETFQRPYFVDRNGDFICNKAGDYFDPPVIGDDSRWIVTVKKNVAAVPTWVLTYENTVNSGVFTLDGVSIAARVAKLSGLRISSEQNRNDIVFRTLTMIFHLRAENWDARVENLGLRQKNSADPTGKRIPCTMKNGEPVTAPVLLNTSGYQESDPSTTNHLVLTFRIYGESNFTALPLT